MSTMGLTSVEWTSWGVWVGSVLPQKGLNSMEYYL